MGPYTIVDLHLEVDPQLSISMAYAAAARLKDRVMHEVPEVRSCIGMEGKAKETGCALRCVVA